MGFTPRIPVQLQIRKIIFDNFNNVDARFNNDEIFELLRHNGDVDMDWTIDDLESFFSEICDSGLVRNIAQNFTTMWFKLFEPVEQIRCGSCNLDVHLGGAEERSCPNPGCNAVITT